MVKGKHLNCKVGLFYTFNDFIYSLPLTISLLLCPSAGKKRFTPYYSHLMAVSITGPLFIWPQLSYDLLIGAKSGRGCERGAAKLLDGPDKVTCPL